MSAQELKHILMVEDDADIRKIVQISLEQLGGFKLDICHSGLAALDRLKADKPDLLILDVMMPVMDGPTVLREIRKSTVLQDIPAIFMTAKVQAHEIQHYLALGVLGVIHKPFDPLTLPEQIRTLWQTHELA